MNRRKFLQNSFVGSIGASWLALGNVSKSLGQTTSSSLGKHEPFKGVFPIMQTPYLEDDSIDFESMSRQVDFAAKGGAGGMVWPQLASEFYVLTDEERMKTAELMVNKANGRLPMIVGVQSTNYWKASLKLAKHAQSIGADGIISLPPYTSRAEVEVAADYYRALAREVDLPIFIQNSGGNYGPAMPTEKIIELAKEYPSIAYIKEESKPVTHRIGAMVEQGEGILRGVFSGGWGSTLLNELRRGCVGTMPGSSIVDVYAKIIDLFLDDKREEAQEIFDKVVSLVRFKGNFSIAMEKEILTRRGVFRNTRMRIAPYKITWDEIDQEEFEVLFNNLKPHFSV